MMATLLSGVEQTDLHDTDGVPTASERGVDRLVIAPILSRWLHLTALVILAFVAAEQFELAAQIRRCGGLISGDVA